MSKSALYAASVVVAALSLWAHSAAALPVRTYSSSSCAGLYGSGELSARLAACPGIEDQLIWEDGTGQLYNHSGYGMPGWTSAQVARLDALYDAIAAGNPNLGLDCPDPQQNFWSVGQTNDSNGNPVHTSFPRQLFFTANQAFDTYAAHVAWNLYLEANHLVPWSLLDHPASELVEFFDSRRYHTRFPTTAQVGSTASFPNAQDLPVNIQWGRDFWNATTRDDAGWEAVCDPRVGYQFLSGQGSSTGASILGPDELTTMKNITWWFHENVAHGTAPPTAAILSQPGIYLEDRLRTTATGANQQFIMANDGCPSASNLFYDLAKSANVPVLRVVMSEPNAASAVPGEPPFYIDDNRHGALVYGWGNPATTRVLQHTDDIYAIYGEVFPMDATGVLAADPAQVYFDATWLAPSQLTSWGFQPTNDYSLQTPTSTYGNNEELEVETQGIFLGYWTPTTSPESANLPRFTWYSEGQLCSFAGSDSVLSLCQDSWSVLQYDWTNAFGQSTLTSVDDSISISAPDYFSRIQTCTSAVAATAPVYACPEFEPGGAEYSALSNRTSSDYWVGVPSPFTMSVSPWAQIIARGVTDTFQLSTGLASGNVPGRITLSASDVPPGMTVTFSPPTVMTGETASVSVYMPPDFDGDATYYITVTGTTNTSTSSTWLDVFVDDE